ncbi:hypothetical protein M5X00_13510 [Paenibacillus alvei]|uniref:hypothetical protein n=1 Tax=Paenibacillus alvei TaxID=44250 RepID=UPI000287CB9C|nr:hypothetical protein [Paenibacillus alvei]EJW13850.1 hypothetical protein PAV_109p00800 [Paenibacillus alvei DSM 29]MCY9545197.1 hypothetical protein [Paenibacillus alvei]MCY9708337.1 hypothetical protein [Paenibacillus alvei]MCY9732975.1 hypothetical protein [Paenibacillus alvei]MCY9755259.1 hypothetical protein [Paenibacillus alvei]
MKLSRNEMSEIRLALEQRLEELSKRLVSLADQGEAVLNSVKKDIKDCNSALKKFSTELKDTECALEDTK